MQFQKNIALLIGLFTILAFTPLTVAKEKTESDGLAQVILITAKEGQSQALEDAIADYHHYMANKKGAWRYTWYQIITGPNTGKYIARSGDHNWADFDVKNDWDKAAGKKFVADVLPNIVNSQVSISRTVSKIGVWPDSMKGYNYILLTKWHIKPGQDEAFNEGLKKIDAALKENGWPSYYAFTDTVSGGYGNTRMLVSPRKSFADMAPKEPKFIDILNKSMGKKEAKEFLAEWGKTYKSGEFFMLKYLPKASKY